MYLHLSSKTKYCCEIYAIKLSTDEHVQVEVSTGDNTKSGSLRSHKSTAGPRQHRRRHAQTHSAAEFCSKTSQIPTQAPQQGDGTRPSLSLCLRTMSAMVSGVPMATAAAAAAGSPPSTGKVEPCWRSLEQPPGGERGEMIIE